MFAKYLWEINIEELPLAWINDLQKARLECPDGMNLTYTFNGTTYTHFIHPVLMHSKLISTFNEYKSLAQNAIHRTIYNPREFVPSIMECDTALYNLLYFWLLDWKMFEGLDKINPFEVFSKKDYLNFRFYSLDDLIAQQLIKHGICDTDIRLYPYSFDLNDLKVLR